MGRKPSTKPTRFDIAYLAEVSQPTVSLPQTKLGIYMGLFNVFVVVPQLLVATVMGSIKKTFFPDQPIWTIPSPRSP